MPRLHPSRFVPPRFRNAARELRSFLRSPLVSKGGAEGPTVVLYGVPYVNWNEALTRPGLWHGIARLVVRMPALLPPLPLRRLSSNLVFIPMKESHARALPTGVRALVPSRTALDTLADKEMFVRFLEREKLLGLSPRIYPDVRAARFPCVMKRTDCHASFGVSVVWSAEEYEALLVTPEYLGKNVVLQEAIPGTTEYSTYCVCLRGRVLWSRTFINELESPLTVLKWGNSLGLRVAPTPEAIRQNIEAVLSPLAFSGPCNVDYRMAGNEMRIFEINPRLGGSLMLDRFRDERREALACLVANAA